MIWALFPKCIVSGKLIAETNGGNDFLRSTYTSDAFDLHLHLCI